jgi:hypothetical protein
MCMQTVVGSHGAQLGNAGVDEAKANGGNNVVPKQAGSSAVAESEGEGDGNGLPCT